MKAQMEEKQAKLAEEAKEKAPFGIVASTSKASLLLRPEKFKILLGFFQIFSNFKDTYTINWPDAVNEAMEYTSQFNFVSISTTVDCLI